MNSKHRELKKIKDNFLFTIDDIAYLIMSENDFYDYDSAKNQAIRVMEVIRSNKWKCNNNEYKHRKLRDYKFDLELFACIDVNRLIEIDWDLKQGLTAEEYQLYKMVLNDYDYEYIWNYLNIKHAYFYRLKNKIANKVYTILRGKNDIKSD